MRFKGIAAHAANSPHLGRSALDAVTLMTTGTNFLNEHIIEKARVHYAITNSGGISPNVVQAQAEVLYLIRAPEMTDVQHIYDRVAKIAEGAALMTETTVEMPLRQSLFQLSPESHLRKCHVPCPIPFWYPGMELRRTGFCETNSATLTPNDRQNSLNNIAATGGENGKAFALRHRETVLANESLHMPPPITCLRHRLMSRRQLETACCPVFQPLFCRRYTATYVATG